MGNHEKAVLSKKNKYYISKHRYYELKHFCLQYNEWIEELKKLNSQGGRSAGGEIHSNPQFSDPTAEIAMRQSQLQQNIEMIKVAAIQTDRVLFNYLIKAVTEESSTAIRSSMKRLIARCVWLMTPIILPMKSRLMVFSLRNRSGQQRVRS